MLRVTYGWQIENKIQKAMSISEEKNTGKDQDDNKTQTY